MGGSIGQAQTGFLKSIPKLTKINGDDNFLDISSCDFKCFVPIIQRQEVG
jgi:hypothetical protein